MFTIQEAIELLPVSPYTWIEGDIRTEEQLAMSAKHLTKAKQRKFISNANAVRELSLNVVLSLMNFGPLTADYIRALPVTGFALNNLAARCKTLAKKDPELLAEAERICDMTTALYNACKAEMSLNWHLNNLMLEACDTGYVEHTYFPGNNHSTVYTSFIDYRNQQIVYALQGLDKKGRPVYDRRE
jgi:hypothetical protein